MARVSVYVDGMNLYYRALRRTPYRWLNIKELAMRQLQPGDQIVSVKYYTAHVSGRLDPDAPRRQQIYLKALKTLSDVSMYYGNFLPKTKWRPVAHDRWKPHVFIEVHDTEEKGSDVNLAAHLVRDAFLDAYDVALVMSQDTDLCEPIRIVSKEVNKPVGLVWLDGRQPNKKLKQAASFVRHITVPDLRASQLPEKIMGKDGRYIERPESWRDQTVASPAPANDTPAADQAAAQLTEAAAALPASAPAEAG